MYILCVKWSLYIVLLMEYIFTFKIIAFAFYAFFQYLFSAMKNGKNRVFCLQNAFFSLWIADFAL